jgi:hypothetical protein
LAVFPGPYIQQLTPEMHCVAGPTEQPALDAYVAAYKPTGVDACLQTLQQAANSKSVPAELVEGALVYLERNHKAGGAHDSPCSSSTGPKPSLQHPPPPPSPTPSVRHYRYANPPVQSSTQ